MQLLLDLRLPAFVDLCDGTGVCDDMDEYRRLWPCPGCDACAKKEKNR